VTEVWARSGHVRLRPWQKRSRSCILTGFRRFFEENKKLVREVLEGRFSKKLSNKVAGYLVNLKKLELKKLKAEEGAEAATEPSTPEP
jgi:ribosomal protein S17E